MHLPRSMKYFFGLNFTLSDIITHFSPPHCFFFSLSLFIFPLLLSSSSSTFSSYSSSSLSSSSFVIKFACYNFSLTFKAHFVLNLSIVHNRFSFSDPIWNSLICEFTLFTFIGVIDILFLFPPYYLLFYNCKILLCGMFSTFTPSDISDGLSFHFRVTFLIKM